MNKDLVRCSGIRTSWPYKGSPCGAWGKYEVGGKLYCGQHFATACLVAASSAKIAEEELLNKLIDEAVAKGNVITADDFKNFSLLDTITSEAERMRGKNE